MSKWTRERINPIEYLKRLGWEGGHISYDPKLRKGDYSIIRQSAHDGTLLFEMELLANTLHPVVTKTSFYKPKEAEFDAAKEVRYVVGPVRLSSVYGRVNLPVGRFPGMRQRTRMAVRVQIG